MEPMLEIIVLLAIVTYIIIKYITIINKDNNQRNEKLTEERVSQIFNYIVKEAEKKGLKIEEETTENKEEINETEQTLNKIPNFNKEKFLSSAKKAFELILSSFSKGDTETLEKLVSKNVAKKFQEILNKRQAEGITAETDLISFDSAEITEAKITKNDLARITVKFISEQVNLLKNKDGEVIEGDDKYIQNITDVWTFERNITSTNPNWLLTSTKKS